MRHTAGHVRLFPTIIAVAVQGAVRRVLLPRPRAHSRTARRDVCNSRDLFSNMYAHANYGPACHGLCDLCNRRRTPCHSVPA